MTRDLVPGLAGVSPDPGPNSATPFADAKDYNLWRELEEQWDPN